MASVPITGLTMLGQTLQQGSADYANRRLSLADEQRRRGDRLTDIQSQRGYEEGQLDKLRNLQLADEQRRRGESLEDAQKRQLLELAAQMKQEAMRRGLLSPAEVGNVQAEARAASALTDQLQKEAAFQQAQPGNAQAALADLSAQEQDIRQKMSRLEAQLSSQPTVDQRQVQARALEIATANAGGKTPTREQIAEAMQGATKEAHDQAFARWYQDKQDATVQFQILSNQLNTLRQQQASLTSTFKVAPSAPVRAPASPLTVAPAAPVQSGNPMTGFLQQLNGATPPPAPAESPVAATTRALTMAPPEVAPQLRQARTAQLADAYAKMDEPIMATTAKIADTQGQLGRMSAGLNPFQGVNPGPVEGSPQAQGEYITRLLMRQAALTKQLEDERKARQQGKSQLLSGLRLNTPSQFVPIQPPSTGLLLSTP